AAGQVLETDPGLVVTEADGPEERNVLNIDPEVGGHGGVDDVLAIGDGADEVVQGLRVDLDVIDGPAVEDVAAGHDSHGVQEIEFSPKMDSLVHPGLDTETGTADVVAVVELADTWGVALRHHHVLVCMHPHRIELLAAENVEAEGLVLGLEPQAVVPAGL